MTVEPNGVVHLLENIPLNNTYQHTIKFPTTEAQYAWFVSKKKHSLTRMTYQRADTGIMRVQLPADSVYGCNYLMFQNTGFASKWFYAFITGVEYVNNTTTEITYELDDMQTWFPFCEMKQCFIERSHTATDGIGDNLVAETVPLGEYVCNSRASLLLNREWSVAVVGTCKLLYPGDKVGDLTLAGYMWVKSTTFNDYGNLYGGLRVNVIDMSRIEEGVSLEQVVGSILSGNKNHNATGDDIGKLSGLVTSVLMFPQPLVSGADEEQTVIRVKPDYNRAELFEGYGASVKNNKLFTYPYSMGQLTNNQGDLSDFPIELFSGVPTFELYCDMSPDPSVIAVPIGYKGVDNNYNEAVFLTDLPFLSVSTDTYNQWLALNRSQRRASYVNTALGFGAKAAAAVATGGASLALDLGMAGVSALQTVNSLNAQAEDAKLKPPNVIGGKGSTALYVAGGLRLDWVATSIRREWAERADNYFSMFGYAINDVGQPNITSRPNWNYIKVANPTIIGKAPAQAISRIANILTNGITFWHNGDNVGNYSLDNSV